MTTRKRHKNPIPRTAAAVAGLLLSVPALGGGSVGESFDQHLAQHADKSAAATRYVIAGDASELLVLAYRAGPLARLGHNHVIVTRALSGSVSLNDTLEESAVVLEFPVDSLAVDEPEVRRAEGPAFEGTIPPDDIAATRENMLGPELLEADSHPTIRIESTAVSGSLPNVMVTASIAVKGRRFPVDVPVSVNTFEGGLVAVGRVRIDHSAVGLEAFRVALGSLRVADELQIRFRIVARTEE